jgi:hypothetical protein
MLALHKSGGLAVPGQITLVDLGDALLGQFSDKAHKYALKKLTEAGAEVRLRGRGHLDRPGQARRRPDDAAIQVVGGRWSSVSLRLGLIDLAIVSLIAALTPIVVRLLSRLRVPQVVILIAGGILVGPQVLGLADPAGLELVSNVGLGFLFLLAGYELDLGLFRERAGRIALKSWLVTLVVAIGVTGALAAVGFVRAFVPIAIGLTTTALGTLLPILRDNQMLEGRFGAFIMAAGAVGEFLPIVAVAIFLSANGAFLGLLSLVVIGTIALLFTFVPKLARHKRIAGIFPRVSTLRRKPAFAGPWSCSSPS